MGRLPRQSARCRHRGPQGRMMEADPRHNEAEALRLIRALKPRRFKLHVLEDGVIDEAWDFLTRPLYLGPPATTRRAQGARGRAPTGNQYSEYYERRKVYFDRLIRKPYLLPAMGTKAHQRKTAAFDRIVAAIVAELRRGSIVPALRLTTAVMRELDESGKGRSRKTVSASLRRLGLLPG